MIQEVFFILIFIVSYLMGMRQGIAISQKEIDKYKNGNK